MRAKPWLALLPWLALVSAEPDEGGILPLPSGGTPSLHPEIPGFHSFRPEVQLPDYECQFLPEDWYELKQNFVGSLNFFREFGAVRFQSETDEEQLGDLQIWLNYAVAFSDHNWSVRDCPFANFIRRLYLWSLCTIVDGLPHRDHVEWKATGEPVCQELRDAPISLARELFGRDHSSWGLRSWEQIYVFMNTRFADLMTMWVRPAEEAIRIVAPHVEPGVDCELQEEFPSGWDWKGHLTRMSDPSVGSTSKESYHDAIHYTLNPHAMQNMEGKVQECPMGWLALLVHQMLICMGGLTEQAAFSAAMLEKSFFLIEQDKGINWVLHALLKTRWPINRFFFSTGLMVQARRFVDDQPRYQHKPYELDFHPSELLYPFDERHQLPHGFSVAALRQRRSGFGRSESYAQLLRALEMSVTRAGLVGGRPVVMFTLVYGERYARYLANWIRRSAAFGHEARTLIFCLDEHTAEACRASHGIPELCVQGGVQTTSNKFHLMSAIVNSGVDVLYLDFDLVFFKDPLPPILTAAKKAELLLTRDLGSECINIGVVFMKSHPANAKFLQDLIIWLWHHPYEFCQKAFAGLMGLEDLQWNSLYGNTVEALPRWGFLDSLNAFVTSSIYGEATGWTGDEDRIVIYHYLDGTGAVDPAIAVRGYVNLFDLFYANDKLNLSDPVTPLYLQDEQVKSQLDFSRHPAPIKLQPCSHIEESAYPSWKQRQRAQLRERRELWPVQL